MPKEARSSLYLLPDSWGKGYGKQLLQAAVDDLQTLGFRDVFLWVLWKNRCALRFYKRFGFTDSGACKDESIGGKALHKTRYSYTVTAHADAL